MYKIHELEHLYLDQRVFDMANKVSTQLAIDWPDESKVMVSSVTSPMESALYIEINSEIVSIIVWTSVLGMAFISSAWTSMAYRGRGLYKALYSRLREIAVERQYPCVACGVHGDNAVSRAAHESFGMKQSSIVYYEPLCFDTSGSKLEKVTGSNGSVGASAIG